MRSGATSAVDTLEKCGKVQNSVILCRGFGLLSHIQGSRTVAYGACRFGPGGAERHSFNGYSLISLRFPKFS